MFVITGALVVSACTAPSLEVGKISSTRGAGFYFSCQNWVFREKLKVGRVSTLPVQVNFSRSPPGMHCRGKIGEDF